MAQVESRNRATSNPAKRARVLEEISSKGIEDVLLWFTDIEGHLKSFSITSRCPIAARTPLLDRLLTFHAA